MDDGGYVPSGRELMTPAEVARAFGVDPKTVSRWARAGQLGSIRTPGGHRRFRRAEVLTFLERPADRAVDEASEQVAPAEQAGGADESPGV